MGKQLQPQLSNADEIREILKEVEFSYTLADGRKVETLLVYLPITGGKSSHSEFFEKVKDGILNNFVLKCDEIEKKLGLVNKHSAESLFLKSISMLSKHTAHGELGELLLFTLLDVYLKAPKLLSKITLKSSRTVAVHGADAVHGQFYDGAFRLYLGEAKLHKDFKPAASKAAESMSNAKEKSDHEFRLLDCHLDFPGIEDETKDEILDLLDPFNKKDLTGVVHFPCFIGFKQAELLLNEDEFIYKYKTLATDYIEDFYTKLEKKNMKINETVLILLPFSCIDELVDEFISYMGITK
jgi:hypothetical protein